MPLPAIVAALTRMAPSLMGGGSAVSEGAGALYKGAGGAGMDVFGGSAAGSVVGQGINAIINKIAQTAHAATHPLETMQKGMDNLKQTFTAVPATILKAKETIVGVASAWVEAMAAPAKTVKELGDAVNQFTRLSNPAGVKQFEYRVENTFATLGTILQPILDALTRSAEKVGDTFAKLKPALAPAMKAVEGLIDFFATRFADSMELVAPLIEGVSMLFNGLVQNMKLVQEPITFLIRKFNELRRGAMELLGIPTGFDKDARSDVAIREPRFTNTEAIQREMARNSLMASLGPQQERKDVPSLLKMLVDYFKQEFPGVIGEALKKAWKDANPLNQSDTTQGNALGRGAGSIANNIAANRDREIAELTRQRRIQFQE